MPISKSTDYEQEFRRGMLRAAFHSLFWGVIIDHKQSSGLRLQDIADRLGVNKSFVSRSFTSPPNWRIDTLSDFANALDLDLVVEARDRKTGRVFTPYGVRSPAVTGTHIDVSGVKIDQSRSQSNGQTTVMASL